MGRLIDSFLFFQELDLLEVRLEYLDPCVDLFVIVEAAQTFTGRPKEFVYAAHAQRFARFAHKIVYHQITDTHASFTSLAAFLAASPNPSHRKVLDLLRAHTHYPKDELQWVLDSYHRECLHLPLDQVSRPGDVIVLSDLDEIPARALFEQGTVAAVGARPRVCRQHEFRYFANFFHDSNWLGTIYGQAETMNRSSFNVLRVDSKRERRHVEPEPVFPGGFHFTSCGDVDAIRRKIASWGHQEFNHPAVLANLERNIRTGQDIFRREHGTSVRTVPVVPGECYDAPMAEVLRRHPALLATDPVIVVPRNRWLELAYRMAHKGRRLLAKLVRRLPVRR